MSLLLEWRESGRVGGIDKEVNHDHVLARIDEYF